MSEKNNGPGLLVTGRRTGVQRESKTRCRFDFNTVAGRYERGVLFWSRKIMLLRSRRKSVALRMWRCDS